MSIYVIGDIHGCFDTFMALIAKLPEDAKICLVGDLIDRGPKSRQVVQYVIDNKIDCVQGNHEDMMVEQPVYWPLNGGMETLESYADSSEDRMKEDGIHLRLDKKLFKKHQKWMTKLPVYIEYPEVKNGDGRYLVVSHSILHDVWKLKDTTEEYKKEQFRRTAMWSRDFHVVDNPDIYNVIGHTPQEFEPHITKIYSNIDTGCCYNHYGYDTMTALKFPEMDIITQENIDIY